MTSPLDDIRVVEFANFAAAPAASAIMADLGAEVIKVEAVGGDPIRGLMMQARVPQGQVNPDHAWQFINRGKQSIELNLDDPAGVEVAHQLVATADVVVTNLLKERRQRFQRCRQSQRWNWENSLHPSGEAKPPNRSRPKCGRSC